MSDHSPDPPSESARSSIVDKLAYEDILSSAISLVFSASKLSYKVSPVSDSQSEAGRITRSLIQKHDFKTAYGLALTNVPRRFGLGRQAGSSSAELSSADPSQTGGMRKRPWPFEGRHGSRRLVSTPSSFKQQSDLHPISTPRRRYRPQPQSRD